MTMPAHEAAMTGRTLVGTERLMRWVCRLYPEEFRGRFVDDIASLFVAELRRVRCEGGRPRAVVFAVREISAVCAAALMERRRSMRNSARGRALERSRGDRQGPGRFDTELRLAARRLARSPAFTIVSILTLALGVGATTAIFSLVNGILIRPMPFPDSGRLLVVMHAAPGLGFLEIGMSEGSYLWYSSENHTLEDLVVINEASVNITGDGAPERVEAAEVSPGFFALLRVPPAVGRGFVEGEDEPDAASVVLIGDGLWRRRFGADPGILGRTINVDGKATEVVGVLPRGFDLPSPSTDVWIPAVIDPARINSGRHRFAGVARMREGVRVAAVKADLDELTDRLPEGYPGVYSERMLEQTGLTSLVETLKESTVGDIRTSLWILLGTVGLVLMIACGNVANLFLVRAEVRQREVAVRRALGATGGDVARYFLAESMLLALGGAAAGVALAHVALRALQGAASPAIPRLHEIRVDPSVLGFAVVVSILSGLVLGIVPVVRALRLNLLAGLKEAGRGTGAGRQRGRNALVVVQVALALVLLLGSGLMLRSFWNLRALDPGFEADGVVAMQLSLPSSDYPTTAEVASTWELLREALDDLPDVASAALVTNLPLTDGRRGTVVKVEDRPVDENDLGEISDIKQVTPGYFETMAIPVERGRGVRGVAPGEMSAGVVVNRVFADQRWPGEDPLGKRVGFGRDAETWHEVVGVVGNVKEETLHDDPPPIVYYPLRVADESGLETATTMSVAVRARPGIDPAGLLPSIRSRIWELDPDLPIADVRTMQRVLASSIARTSFTMALLAISAVIALVLGSVGLYGVISYVVSQRTQEIGLRMALGAHAATVRRMVVRQGLVVAGVGVAIGVCAGLVLTRLMAALLYGVTATDPPTFVAVPVLLIAVATAAAWLPARRAARVDPAEALRAN